MSIKGRVATLVASALLALGLVACGGGGNAAPEEVANYQVAFQQPFTGREVRDPADLDVIVQDAVTLYEQRSGQMKKDSEETELAKKANSVFNQANQAYREGNYAEAQKLYESVLADYPLHYGANVNLTLALLQQEKNEEALVQALSCMDLAPGETGVMLNIQAAGVACGFSMDDIETGMDKMLDALGRGNYENDSEGRVRDFGSYYLYNKVWDSIEVDLSDAAKDTAAINEMAAEGDTEAEAEEGAAVTAEQEAEPAVEADVTGNLVGYEAYEAIGDDLSTLETELMDDTDVAALRAYLYYVGLQLGYEVDPSLIEPVHSMPYIAVDNNLCTIRVVSLSHSKGEDYQLALQVTNKTDDVTFSLGKGKQWTLNGKDMLTQFGGDVPITVPAGETQDVTVIIGYSGDDEVTSVTGEIVVSSKEQNNIIARYPINWEVAEATE